DLVHTAADYEPFSVSGIPAAPVTSGGTSLPGNILTNQFYVLKPTASVTTSPYTGTSDRLFPGSNIIDHWNGFDISINARLGHGVIVQGGTSTGRQVYDNCDVVDPANASKYNGHTLLGTFGNLANLAPLASVVQSVGACHIDQA